MRMSMFGCRASASRALSGASISRSSTITRTRTPRPAARNSASAASVPILSLLQMKYCTSIERCAFSTSQARANSASAPVSST
jgi:hypothetical protein